MTTLWSYVEELIREGINDLLKGGLKVGAFLRDVLGLTFLNIDHTKMKIFDSYAVFQVSPHFIL